MRQGYIHLGPLFAAALLVLAGAIYINSKVEVQSPVSSPMPTALSTDSPQPSPTLAASTKPSPSMSPTPQAATPIPTLAPTPAPVSGPPSAGYSRYTIGTEAGSFLIDVVSLPSSAQMITDTASDGECGNDCPVMPLSDYISRNGAYAGINGSYFCPSDYADCSGKINSFDFPVYNTRIGRWINSSNLFWNNRSMLLSNGGFQLLRNANSYGGGGSAGIVNHPGVLENGNVIANDMSPSANQLSKGTRGGIGFNSSNIFLVIARNASVQDLGFIFKSLGATNALNLDGGGSVALWYGGYKVGPGRNLPNAIVFK